MGFFVMLLSFILGIYLIVLGSMRKRFNKNLNLLIVVLGIILTIFAIWLGLPK